MIPVNAPSNSANSVAPFSPIGANPAGQESAENRNTVFQAVEQSAEGAAAANRRSSEERPNDVEQRENLKAQQRKEQQNKQDKIAQQQERQDQDEIRQLSARDQEVRDHERAHSSVGGDLTGAPSFSFVRGPDGVAYAVSGEVQITQAYGDDPKLNLEQAERIRRAALAPAEPSTQDRQVAAAAVREAIESRSDIAAQERFEQQLAQEQREVEKAEKAEQEAERKEQEKAREDEQARLATQQQDQSQQNARERLDDLSVQTSNTTENIINTAVVSSGQHADAGSLIDQNV